MSALFEETALYIVWKNNYGVNFETDTELAKYISRDPHTWWGGKIKIGYLLHEDDKVSVTMWNRDYHSGAKGAENKASVISECFRQLKPILEGNDRTFLVHSNNNHHKMARNMFDPKLARVIPADARGFNKFKGADIVVSTGVTHPNKSQADWLERRLGITAEAVYRMFRIHTTYQAVNRTSIRDPNTTTDKMIIVGDKATHDWLLSLYKGAQSLGQVIDAHKMTGLKPREAKKDRLMDRAGYGEKRDELKTARRRLKRSLRSEDATKTEQAQDLLDAAELSFEHWRLFG